MSASKTVEVEVSDVKCDECSKRAERAFCSSCLSDFADDAGDRAIENYTPPGEEMRADVASRVRGWLEIERLKPASDITPELAAMFERCAEDLEVG